MHSNYLHHFQDCWHPMMHCASYRQYVHAFSQVPASFSRTISKIGQAHPEFKIAEARARLATRATQMTAARQQPGNSAAKKPGAGPGPAGESDRHGTVTVTPRPGLARSTEVPQDRVSGRASRGPPSRRSGPALAVPGWQAQTYDHCRLTTTGLVGVGRTGHCNSDHRGPSYSDNGSCN